MPEKEGENWVSGKSAKLPKERDGKRERRRRAGKCRALFRDSSLPLSLAGANPAFMQLGWGLFGAPREKGGGEEREEDKLVTPAVVDQTALGLGKRKRRKRARPFPFPFPPSPSLSPPKTVRREANQEEKEPQHVTLKNQERRMGEKRLRRKE